MNDLSRLLRQVAGVYRDLEDALIPTRRNEPPDSSPDPTSQPAPANLQVTEHRHKLVRGLRWWVDAVHPKEGRVPRVGQDVGLMCGMLERAIPVMEVEDRETLRTNLREWLADSWGFMGEPETPVSMELPPGALDQRVRVADAARILGCNVRTVRRRVPIERRQGGLVLLRDVWRCDHCDLRHGECAHTRVVTVR